jgi:nitronate monooxygenase
MGDPVKYIDKIHARGIKVISMVTNVEDAVTLTKNRSDIIMAQGAEAGGHRFIFNNNFNVQHIPLIGTMSLQREQLHLYYLIKEFSVYPLHDQGIS